MAIGIQAYQRGPTHGRKQLSLAAVLAAMFTVAGLSAGLFTARPVQAATTSTCTKTFNASVGTIDGRAQSIRPGDVVCLTGSSLGKLTLRNIAGTSTSPVIVRNSGGQVSLGALHAENSKFFNVLGNGVSGVRYGITVTGKAASHAVWFHYLTEQAEIAYINITGGSQGITWSSKCGSSPYGYISSSWVQHNTIIHDNRIENTPAGEGMYIGPDGADSTSASCTNPKLQGVRIYRNYVTTSGKENINVKGASDCRVYDNETHRAALKHESGQGGNIGLAEGSVCDVYNNIMADSHGMGLTLGYGNGSRAYNNIIINAGQSGGTYGAQTGWAIKSRASATVLHNTIINSRLTAIALQGGTVKNNLIAGGNTSITGATTTSNNLIKANIADAGFMSAGNYRLSPSSPAVDAGVGVGITTDMVGTPRPQGRAVDIGAFELAR